MKINLNAIEYSVITEYSILAYVTEEEIFKHYLSGEFPINHLIISPLRPNDINPSFGLFFSEIHHKLMYKDFGGTRGDCFQFVANLPQNKGISYPQILKNIFLELCLDKPLKSQIQADYTKPDTIFKVVPRDFKQHDLDFWKSFGISLSTLLYYRVTPVSVIYINDNPNGTVQPKFTYAFREFKDNKLTYKIYKPFEKKENKWRSNHNSTIHQGYTQLNSKGKILIITKSLKDVMNIRENLKLDAVGIQSESVIISEKVINEYFSRFRQVIGFFDNDDAGKLIATKYTELYNIPCIFVPDRYRPAKDPSDLYKQQGLQNYLPIIKQLIAKI